MSYTTGLTPSGLPQANDPTQTESVSGPNRAQSATQTLASRTAAADDIATDSTKLSLAGAMLSQAATGSDVRFEKVAALRQSIEAGTYTIPSADVASKLVDALLK
jgi:negative regulator of flagellin synthesis FlgM